MQTCTYSFEGGEITYPTLTVEQIERAKADIQIESTLKKAELTTHDGLFILRSEAAHYKNGFIMTICFYMAILS